VRITHAGLNPSDVKNVLGRFPYTTLPRTPGRDFAGVVEAGPSDLVGREVWGTGKELGFTRDGSHAECIVLPADGVAERPARLSAAECAASGVPYTTALDALERTGATLGASLVIVGLGAVGTAAVDLGLARGARVVAAARRPEHLAHLARRGVPAVDLSGAAPLDDAVRERLGGGADVVFDTTGEWLEASIAALGPFGRVAIIAAPLDGHVRTPVLALYRKGGSIVGINSLLYDSAACAKMLSKLARAFDAGELPPPAAPREVPLAAEAYRQVDRGAKGKIVFVMGGA
jgi:NADPH:quinone reductase-like Zn-dependent oxidoreductase